MRRLSRSLAAAVLSLSLAGVTGAAMARDHGDRGDRGEHGRDGGGPPGWSRGGPPPWSNAGGRWQHAPGPEVYGPPPGGYPPAGYGARRGGYLPPEARGGVVQDYGRYRLRQPPRGYAWVRSGRAMVLMDMNTGQVFDVIPD